MKLVVDSIWFIGLFCIGWFISDVSTPDKHRAGINKAIQQCEAELPRHLHCEPVYGARVVEEKGDE